MSYTPPSTGHQPPRPPQGQPGPNRPIQLTPKPRPNFDINTDYGQLEDLAWFESPDNELLQYVTSVNIPCCVHEGNPTDILNAIQRAKEKCLVVGAHIGYPDPKNRGYVSLNISPEDLHAWILVQLGAFTTLCKTQHVDCLHVRPHGALYSDMAQNKDIALAVAKAVKAFDPWMILVMPLSPHTDAVASEMGLQVYQELYFGKRFLQSGHQAVERGNQQGDLPQQAALEQVRRAVYRGQLTTEDGRILETTCQTIHMSPRYADCSALAKQVHHITGDPLPMTLSTAGRSGWL
jgi:5-oxoprolinase (ATP-hydrolysing) subunit A